jgi:hypothetical protein
MTRNSNSDRQDEPDHRLLADRHPWGRGLVTEDMRTDEEADDDE